MTHLLRVLLTTAGLGTATCLAQSATINEPIELAQERRAPGWQGGGWTNSPQDDDDAANDTAAGTEARETDASITTDYPAAAEPFEDPADIPEDEQED